jgi:hypothetical protein
MPKSDFIKNRDTQFSDQLTLFKTNISANSTAIGVTAGQDGHAGR